MTDEPIVETVDPEAAFSVLADGTRIDILRALWEADGQEASFSELRGAVGTRDSGKFNYHLGKLRGRFVRKTDAGYELRSAGRNVVGSLLSGAYTMEGSIEGIELEDPCPFCGKQMSFEYEDERVGVGCADCEFRSSFPVPPGALADHPVEHFPAVADRYLRTLLSQTRNGFCMACQGSVGPELCAARELQPDHVPPGFEDVAVVVYDCDRCGMRTHINLTIAMLDHPIVSAFHYENDADVRDVSVWHLGTVDGDPPSRILEDGTTAQVTYAVCDHRLTLTVDDALAVMDVDRA